MGKIRVKTLGDEGLEKEQKNEGLRKAAGKQQRKEAKSADRRTAKAPGLHGGERVTAVGPSEEELEAMAKKETQEKEAAPAKTSEVKKKKSKKQTVSKRQRSKKYQAVVVMVDKNKTYPLPEALELLPKLKIAKFDETVELHINTLEAGLSGLLTLPHGSGKTVRVAIADPTTASGQVQLDELIKKVEAGTIDFDVLLATPAAMPKLAKVAKVLGPRGLMPNPKNGTITQNPQEDIKKFQAGQMRYKTEVKNPIIHLPVGKLSFGDKKLSENIQTVIKAVQEKNIRKVTLKSTMSPGLKINFSAAQ